MLRGRSVEGAQLAQVAHVVGPGGRDDGWMVWLTHQSVELSERFPSEQDAIAAAEAALDQHA